MYAPDLSSGLNLLADHYPGYDEADYFGRLVTLKFVLYCK